jgi:hypothetical protein
MAVDKEKRAVNKKAAPCGATVNKKAAPCGAALG